MSVQSSAVLLHSGQTSAGKMSLTLLALHRD